MIITGCGKLTTKGRHQHRHNVSDTEREGDSHDPSEEAVANPGPHHGTRNNVSGVAHFLGHVCARLNTDKATGGTDQTNHGGQRNVVPARVVGEKGEVVIGRASVGHDPERDDDSEEACNVENNNEAFDQWKLPGEERVEQVARGQDSPHDEHAVPWFWLVCFDVVQDDESGDLVAGEVDDNGSSGLPA